VSEGDCVLGMAAQFNPFVVEVGYILAAVTFAVFDAVDAKGFVFHIFLEISNDNPLSSVHTLSLALSHRFRAAISFRALISFCRAILGRSSDAASSSAYACLISSSIVRLFPSMPLAALSGTPLTSAWCIMRATIEGVRAVNPFLTVMGNCFPMRFALSRGDVCPSFHSTLQLPLDSLHREMQMHPHHISTSPSFPQRNTALCRKSHRDFA